MTILRAITTAGFVFASAGAAAQHSPAVPAETLARLQAVTQGSQRSDAEKSRDRYRHPVETLAFFGIGERMTVVEIYPGGGWYTRILAPLLKDRGTLYLAARRPGVPPRGATDALREELATRPEVFGRPVFTMFEKGEYEIAPPGSADMVLTFRNLHNWMSEGHVEEVFRAMYRALKPGGVLGVVEHRAPPGAQDPRARSGYVTEAHAIRLAEDAGFRLAAKSEINANPKDTKDYPRGVWTLPPNYALGDLDRAKYAAIGESDRMTLRFVKP